MRVENFKSLIDQIVNEIIRNNLYNNGSCGLFDSFLYFIILISLDKISKAPTSQNSNYSNLFPSIKKILLKKNCLNIGRDKEYRKKSINELV